MLAKFCTNTFLSVIDFSFILWILTLSDSCHCHATIRFDLINTLKKYLSVSAFVIHFLKFMVSISWYLAWIWAILKQSGEGNLEFRVGWVHRVPKQELDGVGPVDNRISIDKLHHFVKKKLLVTHDMWHMTCDTWHMTHDTWHMTHDTWHVTCCGGWTFSQNFSSLAFMVCDLWYLEDLEKKADRLTEWTNESMTKVFVEQPRLHRVC